MQGSAVSYLWQSQELNLALTNSILGNRYSCLENPTDRGAWRAGVHGVAESDTTERLTLLPLLLTNSFYWEAQANSIYIDFAPGSQLLTPGIINS